MSAWPRPGSRLAWRIARKGAIDNLSLNTECLPAPGPGEVQIAVRAIGLNFADVFSCFGLYSATPRTEFVPGLEFSGIVVDVGGDTPGGTQSARRYRVGDRVMGVTRFGAFASLVNLQADYVRPVPEGWSFEEAASYLVQAMTAYYALFQLGALQRGMTVLVHSAAGGVGLQALEILRLNGCKVLGTVGSPGKVRMLQRRYAPSAAQPPQGESAGGSLLEGAASSDRDGTTTASSSSDGSGWAPRFVARQGGKQFREQIKDFLTETRSSGFDLILDSLQGEYLHPGYEAMAPAGRLIVFGAAALTPGEFADLSLTWRTFTPFALVSALRLAYAYLTRPKIDPLKLPGDNKSVMGFNLIWLYSNLELFARMYDQLDALKLPAPLVGKTFNFVELPEALKYFQSGESVGKVVVKVDGKVAVTWTPESDKKAE